MSDVPGAPGKQDDLISRLRAVIGAKDEQITATPRQQLTPMHDPVDTVASLYTYAPDCMSLTVAAIVEFSIVIRIGRADRSGWRHVSSATGLAQIIPLWVSQPPLAVVVYPAPIGCGW